MTDTSKEVTVNDDELTFLWQIDGPPMVSVDSPEGTRSAVAKFSSNPIPDGVDPFQFRFICIGAHTAYTEAGKLPGVAEIQRYCDISPATIKKIIVTEEFAKAMQAVGVPWHDAGGLTAEQLLLMQIITNPTDKRDLKAKLKSARISYPQYRAWLRQPEFARYVLNTAEGLLTDHVPDFNTVLTQKALAGDLNAIKYVYELSGRHDPNKQRILELENVVTRLLEVITRNVTDPETMNKISSEFALIMGATKPSAPGPTLRGEISEH